MASGSGSSSDRKRPAEEIDDYSDIGDCQHESAILHGVMRNLSPVKKGKRASFFEGHMSDGTSKMRVVGFKAEQRKKLLEFSETGVPVVLKDCQIKMSRQGHEMEVLLKNSTKISASGKVFDMCDEMEDKPVPLAEVHKMAEYTRVTVIVKVLSKRKAVKLDGGLTKQDVIVADATGVMTVTLWEEKVDSLDLLQCYKLSQFLVRDYNMKKSLSLSRQGSNIESVTDIGEVTEDDKLSDSEVIDCISEADIVGVKQLGSFNACVSCKGRVEPLTPPGGRCSRSECGMFQRIDRCSTQVSSLLCIQHGRSKESITLWAYGAMVGKLAGKSLPDEVTSRDLVLHSPTFECINFNKNVITGFTIKDKVQSQV